jgi:hypothetical protein
MKSLLRAAILGLCAIPAMGSAVAAPSPQSHARNSALSRALLRQNGAPLSRRVPIVALGVSPSRRYDQLESASFGISMRVDVGWNGRYRADAAWTPVRVTIRNRKSEAVSGTLEIPDTSIADVTQSGQSRSALYGSSITLPAGATKHISLYLPGSDVGNDLGMAFRVGHRTLTSASVFPTPYGDRDITVGALTGDPTSLSWLSRVDPVGAHVSVVPLGPDTLDAIPEVLASFDVIVLTSLDASLLDRQQVIALDRYVRNGGSLLLVGGMGSVATLRPLPKSLLPGQYSGSEALPNLTGLRLLGHGQPPPLPTIVSTLKQVRGAVLATQNGVPLVIRRSLGYGTVEYLAFDPAADPIVSWKAAPALLTRLLMGAAPEAMRRMSLPPGYGAVSFLKPGAGILDVSKETVSLPVLSSEVIVLLAILALLYILLAGPAGFFILRRSGRPALIWLMVPLLALAFMGLISSIAVGARAHDALVNTIGIVQMDGMASQYPMNVYAGLTAPTDSSYHLTYGAAALPSAIIPFPTSESQAMRRERTLGWSFQEGTQTGVTFPPGGNWRTRAAALRTSVYIPGTLRERLWIDPGGDIVGTIENDTTLSLTHPAIIAGRTAQQLSDLQPHQLTHVHLRPHADALRHDYSQMLFRVYGQTPVLDTGSELWRETSLTDRIRDTVNALPETTIFSMLGEVSFVAWTEQPLDGIRLNGAISGRHALTMIVRPLTVDFTPGESRLRSGTLGASFVDQVPALPRYACCNPSPQAIYIGAGGSATFEFEFPRAGHVNFRNLTLSAYGGGPDTSYTGYTDMPAGSCRVYDWRSLQWVPLRFRNGESSLPDPDRFVSTAGVLLVKLQALDDSHELIITDPHQDLQVSGTVVVR